MKTALIIIFLIITVILSIIVMMQEGKSGGLTSSISGGGADTYWSKNKGKSKDAILRKITVVLGILYMLIALFLSSKFI
ncbi:MAG: preprotein translocase subunit SecG [Lachnospiraceae bacterium]|nr:preprotein translocase subunit SecG [Lachnospiraceae bacterium]MBR1815563.1 preprotein translocase subunit SecG [Lachnospiraceae bacterium]